MSDVLLGKEPDVCIALGISRPTLQAMVARGELPVVRVGATGRGVRFRWADVREWVDRQAEPNPRPDPPSEGPPRTSRRGVRRRQVR
jgi:excisionase family DNA binding protein